MVEQNLKNVTVNSKANVYFDGRVTSRTCYREDGTKFTLGIINPGSYIFSVGDREVVHLIAGTAEVLLPNETEWRSVSAPDTFEVIANSNYDIRCYEIVEYLCDYCKD